MRSEAGQDGPPHQSSQDRHDYGGRNDGGCKENDQQSGKIAQSYNGCDAEHDDGMGPDYRVSCHAQSQEDSGAQHSCPN